jgi:hypothetical protein
MSILHTCHRRQTCPKEITTRRCPNSRIQKRPPRPALLCATRTASRRCCCAFLRSVRSVPELSDPATEMIGVRSYPETVLSSESTCQRLHRPFSHLVRVPKTVTPLSFQAHSPAQHPQSNITRFYGLVDSLPSLLPIPVCFLDGKSNATETRRIR